MKQSKRILILGADEMSRAIAERYLRNDNKVLLCDSREERLSVAKTKLKDAAILIAEAGTPERVKATIDAASEKLGGIDVFIHAVNNEGFTPYDEMHDVQWRDVRAHSLDSAFLWGQAMGRKMRDQGTGGEIIFIADALCASQDADDIAHCAMQWGIKGMMRCMATALGPMGITVNAVCTDALDTKTADYRRHAIAASKGISDADYRKEKIEKTLVGRLQSVEDVAELCAFLTDEAINISGQALMVNGGTGFN